MVGRTWLLLLSRECRSVVRTEKSPPKHDFDGLFEFREVWSGWAYAYRTFWVDPGPEWDVERVSALLGLRC